MISFFFFPCIQNTAFFIVLIHLLSSPISFLSVSLFSLMPDSSQLAEMTPVGNETTLLYLLLLSPYIFFSLKVVIFQQGLSFPFLQSGAFFDCSLSSSFPSPGPIFCYVVLIIFCPIHLSLQQWLEYCHAGKKSSCPICKQSCSQKNICRLYFQSMGESATQPIISQKLPDADAEVLRADVKKLELKISSLNYVSEQQQQRLREVESELVLSKDRANKAEALKESALIESGRSRQLLQMKIEELNRSSAECSRLQERSVSLAKELVALKLASDVNLEEEEVLKLASLGGGSNKEQMIDVLKKSLILRNKSYKELMAQCNLLGRGETRSLKKLEKAQEKIKKLKTKVQELERALEEKENEQLRALKTSKRTRMEESKNVEHNSIPPPVNFFSSEVKMENPAETMLNTNDQSTSAVNDSFHSKGTGIMSGPQKEFLVKSGKETKDVVDLDLDTDSFIWLDEDVAEIPPMTSKNSTTSKILNEANVCKDVDQKFSKPHSGASSGSYTEIHDYGQRSPLRCLNSCTSTEIGRDRKPELASNEDPLHVNGQSLDAEMLFPDGILENKHLLPIKGETPGSVEPIIHQGNQCIPGGLGSDGVKRYPGKWCRRAQSKLSLPESSNGDLIAVGADGRGGRIKVLRTQNQLDGKGSSLWPKRCKYGSKQSGRSQGFLQIEHFFVKRES